MIEIFSLVLLVCLAILRIIQARKAQAETISYLDALGEMLGEFLDQRE